MPLAFWVALTHQPRKRYKLGRYVDSVSAVIGPAISINPFYSLPKTHASISFVARSSTSEGAILTEDVKTCDRISE